jgi:putative transposase
MNRKDYNCDLTDAEWAVLAPVIPPVLPAGRPRKKHAREVLCALLYIAVAGRGGGCRISSRRKIVYHYFRA